MRKSSAELNFFKEGAANPEWGAVAHWGRASIAPREWWKKAETPLLRLYFTTCPV